MQHPLALAVLAALSLAAAPAGAADQTGGQSGAQYDADNSARNARDRNGNTLTPMDQGGSKADRTLTAAVRKAIVDNDNLSMDAKNVKVITRNGHVTLRGPVKTTSERTAIANAAAQVKGVKGVNNQLEVEQNP
jgi:hyperosmotically inducible protein